MSLLTLLNGQHGWGTNTSDLPDLYLEWSPTTGPRDTPVWERIPLSDIRSIDISRGRSKELDQYQTGRMTVVLDNRLRKYDPLLGAQGQYIDLPGTSGNYASTPDSAAVSITGDIDIRVKVAMDDWTPSSFTTLVGKGSSGQLAYRFNLNTNGTFSLGLSADGSTESFATSTVVTGFADGSAHWVRVTWVDSTNVVRFFTSDDGASWSQLGGDRSCSAAGIFDSTAPLAVGASSIGSSPVAGNVYYAEVRDGIDGPVVAKFDPNTVPQQATRTPNTWVADDTGETWTINGSAWQWGGTWGTPHSGNIKPRKRIRLRAVWDTTYDLFTGFVDSWDQNYDHTQEATVTITCSDGFAIWEEAGFPTSAYADTILKDHPAAWWRLNEGPFSSKINDSSGNGVTLTTNGQPTFGASGLNDFDSDTAVTFTDEDQGFQVFNAVDLPATGPFTATFLIQTTSTGFELIMAQATGAFGGTGFEIDLDNDGFGLDGGIRFIVRPIGNESGQNVDSTVAINDGEVHHIACVWDGATMYIYIDGTLNNTNTIAGSSLGTPGYILIGGGSIANVNGGMTTVPGVVGTLDEVAIYNYAFTADDVERHIDSLIAPWNGDKTGTRIGRLADAIGWPTTERDIDEGLSTLQSAEIEGALEHARKVTDTEFGEFFFTPDGKVRFIERQNKWKEPYNDPLFTLSDDGSDLGYSQLRFSYDNQLIRNRVTIGYDNGVTFTVNSTESQDDFYIQSYSKTGLIGDDDSEAVDYANYLVGRYKDPLLRVEDILVYPQRDPANMWPKILQADLVYQVNVERTPQGVGPAIDLDYTIEGVSHRIQPRFWQTTLRLSPADTPGAFILDSTSQGVLDSNELGW